jgi:hypothetical protein
MAMTTDLKQINQYIGLGNRNDTCHLCLMELTAKNEVEYAREKQKLVGAHEGRPMIKFRRSGSETCICLEHIHKIAKENPIEETK